MATTYLYTKIAGTAYTAVVREHYDLKQDFTASNGVEITQSSIFADGLLTYIDSCGIYGGIYHRDAIEDIERAVLEANFL